MRMILARHAGFCFGVQRAVDLVEAALEAHGQVYTLGPLMHNRQMVESLRSRGAIPVDSVSEIPNGALAVIRAHGVGPEIYDSLAERNISIIDATCPCVARIHQMIADAAGRSEKVYIVGDAAHPEVAGALGWANGCGAAIGSVEEAEAVPDCERALIAAQTTITERQFEKVTEALAKKIARPTVKNTLCSATTDRQREALEIASQADVMLIVGGADSSNTIKLYELCSALCKNTHLIQTAIEIDSIAFGPEETVGITGGASTPDGTFKEVVTRMNDMEHLDQNTNPAEQENATPVEAPAVCEACGSEPCACVASEVCEACGSEPCTCAASEVCEACGSEPCTCAASEVCEACGSKPCACAASEVCEACGSEPCACEAPADAEPAAVEAPAAVSAPVVEEAPAEPEEEPQETSERTAADDFMADVEKTLVQIRNGQTVTGTVVQITEDEVCVNVGYKADGLIKMADLTSTDVKIGDEIEVEVVKVNDGEGNVLLSQRNIVNRKAWDAIVAAHEAGEVVKGIGKSSVKGGLIADVDGVRAFIPASLLSLRYVEKIEEFIGQEMDLKIIEIDKAKKRAVASRKAVLQDEEKAKKHLIWDKLTEGEVINGIVRRLTTFGAFVDIGGVDGLVHITDLSWNRVNHPSDVVAVNQEIPVKILRLDPERERISLSYRQTQAKPWDVAGEKYIPGTIVTGKVVRIVPYGAFVELEPGLDGMVHISQCALSRIAKVEDAVSVGDIIRVKILSVDTAAKRVSLSIREALEDEAFLGMDETVPGDEHFAAIEDEVAVVDAIDEDGEEVVIVEEEAPAEEEVAVAVEETPVEEEEAPGAEEVAAVEEMPVAEEAPVAEETEPEA